MHIDDIKTIEYNISFIQKAMKAPILSSKQEKRLLQKWVQKKDRKSLDKIIIAHFKQAVSVALKFRHYNLPLGDLIQEAIIGLLIAAKKFDISKKVRFSTYASWWIRSNLQDYILKNWSIVRTGTASKQKKLFFTLKTMKAKLDNYLRSDGLLSKKGRQKLAEKISVLEKDISYMDLRISSTDHSLNTPISDQESTGEIWQNLLEDTQKTPDHIAAKKYDRAYMHSILNKAFKELTPKEKKIISKRWLKENKETLKALAGKLNLSAERIRQIEKKALGKLRKSLKLQHFQL